jgi:hypothetical protein
MQINWPKVRAYALGAWRSWTIWAAGVMAVLPDVIPLLQSEFATLAPFIPEWMHSRALQVASLVMVLLRVKTTASLAAKGKQK